MNDRDNDKDAKPKISISAARKMLGMVSKNYSDDEVSEILGCLYAIAEESFDEYQDQMKGRKRRKN